MKRKAGLANGIVLLKIPCSLQYQRLFFFFVLVADDVTRLGSRNLKQLILCIGNQIAPGNLRDRNFHGVLVLHLIVFALCRNAPAVKGSHFGVGVKRDKNETVIAAIGAENLVDLPHYVLDFVRGLDRNRFLRI